MPEALGGSTISALNDGEGIGLEALHASNQHTAQRKMRGHIRSNSSLCRRPLGNPPSADWPSRHRSNPWLKKIPGQIP